MNKIGVNIDLSVFFEDERKMVLVLVDPKWESVECLQKRVEFLFNVDSVRFLNSDGSFLPPQEPIEIIKFCKGLKAFVPNGSLEKRKKKKSKKTLKEDKSESEDISNYEETNDATQKKRKYHSLQCGFSASSNLQSAKRLKNNMDININKEKKVNKSSEISSTSEQMPPPPSLVNCKKSDVQSLLSAGKISKVNEAKNSGADDGNEDSKRRQTSTPKQKEISKIADNVKRTFDEEMEALRSGIHSSTLINECESVDPSYKKNPFKGKPLYKNKRHIYFNEAGDPDEPLSKSTPITKNETKKSQTVTIFRCLLNDINNDSRKPRIFQINSLSKGPKKQLLEIQEEIIIPPKTPENSLNVERTDSQQTNSSKIEIIDTITNDTKSLTATTTETTTLVNSEQLSMENTDTTNCTTIAVANDQTATQNLETTKNESKPDDSVNNRLNESSVLSVDSGDLSIVIDDEEDESKNKKEDDESKNNSTKEQSHDLTADDVHDDSSDVQEISDIIDLNESEDNCDSTVNSSSHRGIPNSNIRIHRVLPLCKDMFNLPNVGDIIVFKVPYVDQKFKLVETNFIAGSAEYINKRTSTIKLAIKDGFSELLYVPSKFVCNESHDKVTHLQLKISDMVKPKFCSSF